MSKEDFAAYFAALEKSSDRARSIVYIFSIIYIAVLYYAMNAFAYPVRQFNFDKIRQIVECRYEKQPSQVCINDLGQDFYRSLDLPPQLKQNIEEGLWQHELNLFYDDSVSLRTFQFPIFGITTDRDLVWMIFPFLGILGYYTILLALERTKSLFRYLAEQNKSDATRLRLILSTQLLTSPFNVQSSEFSKFHRTMWKLIAISVFSIPILVSVMTILDQTNLLAVIRGTGAQFRFNYTLAFAFKFVIQVILLALQCSLLGKLVGVEKTFGLDQGFAQSSIAHAEP